MTSELKHIIRVRYAECDQMGFVHHSVYALYLEEARTEILRKYGLIYSEMETEGIIMPVRSMNFQFLKAGKYDDLLSVYVSFVEPPLIRCKLVYRIENQLGTLLCNANMELFFARKSDLRPTKLPAVYLNRIIHLST